MRKNKKHIGFILLLLIAICIIACSKDKKQSVDVEPYGAINGIITCSMGGNGFKITLTDISGGQPLQTVVTSNDGTFIMNDITPGTYYINVEKENCIWMWMTIDGYTYYNSKKIIVKENKTSNIQIYMQIDPAYNQETLTITDIYGNPIGDEILIPQYSSMIVIKLYNETIQNFSWNLTEYFCTLSGFRDTIVGNYSGFTYHTYDLFSNISPTSGTLSPGESIVITGFINSNIYTLDRLDNFSLSHYPEIDFYMNNQGKDISLYMPYFYN